MLSNDDEEHEENVHQKFTKPPPKRITTPEANATYNVTPSNNLTLSPCGTWPQKLVGRMRVVLDAISMQQAEINNPVSQKKLSTLYVHPSNFAVDDAAAKSPSMRLNSLLSITKPSTLFYCVFR